MTLLLVQLDRTAFSTSPLGFVVGAAFTVLLLIACVSDVRGRRIPNRLAATLACGGLLYSLALSLATHVTVFHGMLGLLTGLVLWLPFYLLGWLGAGDVKLFAASGAWLGPTLALQAAVIAALAGGVLALFWMLRVYGVRGTIMTTSLLATSPSTVVEGVEPATRQGAVPYGVALAVGVLVTAWFPITLSRVIHAAF